MLIFAHIFAGALLGLGFWHLTKDRRALPLCIIASVLPDLIDKSLGLLFPLALGGGRTVFHSLMIVGIFLLCVLLFARSRFALLGLGVAGALLLHQVLDEMWLMPANWFFPLLGPFQGQMIPEYIGTYFWVEVSSPSEWIFMIGTVTILAESYRDMIPLGFLSDTLQKGALTLVVVMLLIMGLYLVIAGLMNTTGTFMTPTYPPVPTVLAGMLALCGAVIMQGETFAAPRQAGP
jgi:membrane-bound metal-dependent hydrolase YbcI (DUF457 family)